MKPIENEERQDFWSHDSRTYHTGEEVRRQGAAAATSTKLRRPGEPPRQTLATRTPTNYAANPSRRRAATAALRLCPSLPCLFVRMYDR